MKLTIVQITSIENRIGRFSVPGAGSGIESLQSELIQWQEDW